MHSIYQRRRPNPDVRGQSRIVDPPDGKLPYQPWAAAKAKMIFDTHLDPTPDTINPDARCFMQGVPHHLYNREIEIFQTPESVAIFNMAHHTYRVIPLDGRPHLPERIKLWMGDSGGHWEGDTLVVEVTNHNDQTRFDVVANFHSDACMWTSALRWSTRTRSSKKPPSRTRRCSPGPGQWRFGSSATRAMGTNCGRRRVTKGTSVPWS